MPGSTHITPSNVLRKAKNKFQIVYFRSFSFLRYSTLEIMIRFSAI